MEDCEWQPGMVVRFVSASDGQNRWGSNDDPRKVCVAGRHYELSIVEPHSSHTKVSLVGVQGKFNSVCFELVSDWRPTIDGSRDGLSF